MQAHLKPVAQSSFALIGCVAGGALSAFALGGLLGPLGGAAVLTLTPVALVGWGGFAGLVLAAIAVGTGRSA